jgi:hypothetical protein
MKHFLLGLLVTVHAYALKPQMPQAACSQDLSAYCGNVPLDKDRLTLCLLKNESRLTDKCAQDVAKKKVRFMKDEPCAQDLLTKCYDEHTQQAGLSVRCLFKNKGKLQPQCEKTIAAKMSRMRQKNPCFDDTEKLCPNMVNHGEIDKCLAPKQAQLSKGCQDFMKKDAEYAQKNPCHNDIKHLCHSGLKPQGLAKCLDANKDKLSSACKQSFLSKKAKFDELKEACDADREKFCKKFNGKIIDCLKQHKEKLNMSCSLLLPK